MVARFIMAEMAYVALDTSCTGTILYTNETALG